MTDDYKNQQPPEDEGDQNTPIPSFEEIQARTDAYKASCDKLQARLEAVKNHTDDGRGVEEEIQALQREGEIIRQQLRAVDEAQTAQEELLAQLEQTAQEVLKCAEMYKALTGKKYVTRKIDLNDLDNSESPLHGMSVSQFIEWEKQDPEAANAAFQDLFNPMEWDKEFRDLIAGMRPVDLTGGIAKDIAGMRPADLTGDVSDTLREANSWRDTIREANSWRDTLQSLFTGIGQAVVSFDSWGGKAAQQAQDALAALQDTTKKLAQRMTESVAELGKWAEKVKAEETERAAAFNAGDYATAFKGYSETFEDFDEYLPYLLEELEAYKKETGIDAVTWEDFYKFRVETAGMDSEGEEDGGDQTGQDGAEPPQEEGWSLFAICLRRAIEKKTLADAAKEAAAKIADAAPLLQSTPPKKHTMPNNRLTWALGEGLINAGARNLPVLPEDKKKHLPQTTSYVMATYQDGAGVQIDGNYSMYDRSVNNAITSLFLHGHDSHIFTSEMVYRAMTNGTDSAAPSPQQIAAVTKSIERQRRTHVTVDATEEMERRGIVDANGKPLRFKVGEFLLVLTDIEVSAGGKTKHGYFIQKEPLLYTYSSLTGQVQTVKSSVLDVHELTKLPGGQKAAGASIPNTEGRIAIKEYLIMRIEVIKNDFKRAKDDYRKYQTRRKKDSTLEDKPITAFCKQQHRILFEKIFSTAGIVPNSRQAESKYRDYIFSALDYWQFTGYIDGYSIVKGDKGKMRGFDLKLK